VDLRDTGNIEICRTSAWDVLDSTGVRGVYVSAAVGMGELDVAEQPSGSRSAPGRDPIYARERSIEQGREIKASWSVRVNLSLVGLGGSGGAREVVATHGGVAGLRARRVLSVLESSSSPPHPRSRVAPRD
jgi:hypothetical protein